MASKKKCQKKCQEDAWEEHPYLNDIESEVEVPTKKSPTKKSHTRLTEKAFSPLTIRKITKFGFPIYVGIIADENLDELDEVIINTIKAHKAQWKSDSLQDKRNLAGILSETITEVYETTEGVAVTFFIDKACIQSLFGDFMNHAMCRQEYLALLVMSTGV